MIPCLGRRGSALGVGAAIAALLAAGGASGARADAAGHLVDLPQTAPTTAPSPGDPPAHHAGHTPDGAVETGTDPAKLLLRVEINPQFTDLRGDGELYTTALKIDVPLTKAFAVAMEAPVSYASGFPAPLDDQFGLGDLVLRGRHVWSFERSSLIAGAEVVLKTADDELLGSGKWQVNPTLAFVYYFSSEYLIATAWKQRISVAGDDDREDINQSELRLIGIYVNRRGWWLTADYQPKINWENDAKVSHLLECEGGVMVTPRLGFSIRPGAGMGSNRDRDWSIGFGVRFLF